MLRLNDMAFRVEHIAGLRPDLSRRGFRAAVVFAFVLLAASKWPLTLDKAFVAVVRFGCHGSEQGHKITKRTRATPFNSVD